MLVVVLPVEPSTTEREREREEVERGIAEVLNRKDRVRLIWKRKIR